MGNQYSITVSNGADAVLKDLKAKGFKLSQCIDAAIVTLGGEALQRLVTTQKILTSILSEDDDE